MFAYRDDPEHVGGVQYTGEDSAASVAWQQVGGDDQATTTQQLEQIAGSDQFTELESNLSDDATTVLLYGTVAAPEVRRILYWDDPTDG